MKSKQESKPAKAIDTRRMHLSVCVTSIALSRLVGAIGTGNEKYRERERERKTRKMLMQEKCESE